MTDGGSGGPKRRSAQTHPASADPDLGGRTYAIPFDRVWNAALHVAGGGASGWKLLFADDVAGIIDAEVPSPPLSGIRADVRVRVTLDPNGQTRVDAESTSRRGGPDFGANRRRIRRFMTLLDIRVNARDGQILDSRVVLPLLVLIAALGACSRGGEAREEPDTTAVVDSADALQGRVFERDLVFVSGDPDSVMLVPWLITARALPGGVQREARGLLARAGTWESFFSEAWESAPTRHPWNILPHGSMRLVMGSGDALEQIFYDEGSRHLGLTLEEPLAEWSATRGETFRLLKGSLELATSRVPGWILDLTRGQRVRDAPAGDWAFLVSGDSLQLLLHESEQQAAGTTGSFRAWALLNETEAEWPEVTVAWTQKRAFEKARRDVPVAWAVASGNGKLRLTLTALATEARAGLGDGPQLPVDALFQVSGTVRIEDTLYPVQGLVRHTQP